MNAWLMTLVGYMLIVSIGTQMLPNQKYEQYLRLFAGFLLLVIVLQPLLKIRSADQFLEERMMEFVHEQEAAEEQIFQEREVFLESLEEQDSENVEVEVIPEVKIEIGD